MIRVCHMISGDLWAGAEVLAYNLLQHLKQFDDLELCAILFKEGKLADEIRRLGIPVDIVNEAGRSFSRLVADTRKLFARRPPHVIHSHRYKENILAFLSSRYRGDMRLISTQHGMPEYQGVDRNGKYRLLQKINFFVLSRSFYKVVAVSYDMERSFLSDYGFSKDRIEVIRNGTGIPEASPPGMDSCVFRIGTMGRLFPVKDYPLMVEIARAVCKETDGIRFELAGEGPEFGRIQELVERYGLEKAFLLRGFLNDPGEFYKGLDLYLNTSLHEGIPMSVLEAMSNGIPVIAPDVGGFPEMLNDGVEGYLVEGRDPETFADRCLRLYRDVPLRTEMGFSARLKVKREFSNERMAREYRRLYLDAVHA